MSKLKICVVGGAGFVGSHVADALSNAGHEVHIFDKAPSRWLRNDQSLQIGSLLNPKEVDAAVSGCDVVYNFAALADLNEAIQKPIETIQINILGNAYVLEACKKYNVKRFVYASTVYVYSQQGGFYRCSKQASEQYIEQYQKTFGLDYTILRYGSLYGPRADSSNGLYRIVKSAIENGVVSYAGHPEAMREYIHVDDAAKSSVDVLDEKFCNESVILTGQEPMRVMDLLEMLSEMLGFERPIEFSLSENLGHYIRTPYAYQPKMGKKFIPAMHVDLGQGLLQLIDEVKNSTYA